MAIIIKQGRSGSGGASRKPLLKSVLQRVPAPWTSEESDRYGLYLTDYVVSEKGKLSPQTKRTLGRRVYRNKKVITRKLRQRHYSKILDFFNKTDFQILYL